MYDAIVVGARCAGSPTAMLLAREGYRVLLVDRATFPSDTMSTHFIHPPGIVQLDRWGLLERLAASNCPPFTKMTFDLGPYALTGAPPPADGVAEHYCPRRTVLDKILVDAAVEAGAELREGFSVQEILMDGDRVTGIRGRDADGATFSEEARIVVGADGMRSLVAQAVEAPEYNTKPTLACAYYTYWSGVPIEGAEIYPREGWITIAFPTNDDLVVTFIEWPREEFHAVRTDIEGNFLKKLDLAPGLAERIRSGKREANFVGTGVLPNFLRKPYGAGWALVGDAGYHKDPYMAQGITDAFRDAELLAEAIDAGLSETHPLEEALADYERQRNNAAIPSYELNCQLASLRPPPPEMQQLFAALQGNQKETDRFFGAFEGTVPIPAFFSPENIRRIVSAA
jgi:2-polyprenyl-6-methoxyphenol hydroxylase-like FAD-dependent oxidoreductase